MTQYFPPFFFCSITSASFEKEGAMIPSLTSFEISIAVCSSHSSDSAIKSPNEDNLSDPLALASF